MSRTIGIIAGRGIYPQTFVDAARAQTEVPRLVLGAIKNETEDSLIEHVDVVDWFFVGQLGKLIKYFKKQGVTEAVMVGQITPKNLFDLRPDVRAMMLLTKLKERNAESLFGVVADELTKEGITLLPATTFLEDLLPKDGHVFGPKLKSSAKEDARYGFQIAKETSRLDIGQTVLVRKGTILAVEAFEGTNACIRRGGELGHGKNITLAKVSKPNQDFRFDVPVIGPDTVRNCAQAGVGVIAIEAEKTLLLEGGEVDRLCREHQVSIVALSKIQNPHI